MATLKNNGLRACIALMVLLFGVFMVVKATDNKEERVGETSSKKLVNVTWYFTGSASDDPELASNYSLTQDPNKLCDSDNPEVICQIQAPNNGGQPNMSAPVAGTTVQLQVRAAHQSIEDGTPAENETVTAFRPE